jgi:hypothetical protein
MFNLDHIVIALISSFVTFIIAKPIIFKREIHLLEHLNLQKSVIADVVTKSKQLLEK